MPLKFLYDVTHRQQEGNSVDVPPLFFFHRRVCFCTGWPSFLAQQMSFVEKVLSRFSTNPQHILFLLVDRFVNRFVVEETTPG
jgi:hypothetical protein